MLACRTWTFVQRWGVTERSSVRKIAHPPQLEPSVEQLSGLQKYLKQNQAPFADFAIFGPETMRMQKKLKFHGVVPNARGELVPIELFGPPNLDQWLESYMLFSNAMIMVGAIEFGRLVDYQQHITALAKDA